MTMVVYRDIACANGHETFYALVSRLVLNGWTYLAWSNGSTRTGSAGPAAATDLNASNAWVLVQHTASSRRFSAQRKADSNTWSLQYTDGSVSLTTGNATTPDNHATYTRLFYNNGQLYPNTGTTTTKAHIVIDDATASFILALRRTPFVGGSISAVSFIFYDLATNVVWSANPDPFVVGASYSAADTAFNSITSSGNSSWYKRGISGENYVSTTLENPGSVAGHGTSDPSGIDTEFEVRWVTTNSILGKSTLFRLVQPYRTPIGGMDSGSSFARAAFGQVTIPNDGVALGS